MSTVINLSNLKPEQYTQVGAKAAHLAGLIQAGLPVPPGFIVPATGDLEARELEAEIFAAWDDLGFQLAAVRSSALGEDSGNASWAGQLHTSLAVNKDELITHIKKCRDSARHAQVLTYSQNLEIAPIQQVTVIVQSLVASDYSGVLFTAHPVTGDRQTMVVETIFGLGELLAQGQVSASHYELSHSGEIITTFLQEQEQKRCIVSEQLQTVTLEPGAVPQLSAEILSTLVSYGREVEALYDAPQDIEWAIANDKIWLLQARPITTL